MKKESINFLKGYFARCKNSMILSIITSVLSVICGFVPYVGVYQIIALFLNNGEWNEIIKWCIICAAGFLLKILLFEVSTTLSHSSAYSILCMIRKDLTDKLLKLPLGYVLDTPIGKLKRILVDQVETIELPLAHLIPEGVGYICAPLLVFVYLWTIDFRIALASLITIPLTAVFSGPAMRGVNKKYDEYMKASNHMNSTIVEYIEGIEVIKTFNQSEHSYRKYQNAITDFLKFTLDWFRSMQVGGYLMTSIMPSTLLGVVPIGLLLYSNGQLKPEEYALSIILSMGLVGPLMSLTTYLNSLKAIDYAVSSVNEVMQQKQLDEKASEEVSFSNYDISFEDVAFSYHEGEENVLHDLNIKIRENDFTALVGASGGGKSTIARLIARFWDSREGKITVGGTDIKDIPYNQLMSIISFVAQDNYLFNTSLMENIRMGRPSASDEEVYEAARKAQCSEFIEKLPQGYQTGAGDAGNKLSGGEKQRICLARMILKDAPIIILDEATASMDPENEAKIQQAIDALAENKTLLVIAHRLATITNADRILILDKGTLSAAGTHEELLKSNPIYTKMWNAHIGKRNTEAAGEF